MANANHASCHEGRKLVSRSDLKPPTVTPGLYWRRSVSTALPRIAFQRVKGKRRAFQRGRPQPRTCILKLSRIPPVHTFSPGYKQASLDSRNLMNIATRPTHVNHQSCRITSSCIWMRFVYGCGDEPGDSGSSAVAFTQLLPMTLTLYTMRFRQSEKTRPFAGGED